MADSFKTAWSGFLIAFVPLLYLLYDLIVFRNDVSSWLAMRIAGARLLLQDEHLYADFWDWSQPLVFDLVKIPLLFQSTLEKYSLFVAQDICVQVSIWLLALLSLILCAIVWGHAEQHLKEQTPANLAIRSGLNDLAPALMLAVSISSLILRFDLGDLPHLLVLALGPWILIRWLAYEGVRVHAAVRLTVSFIAALAACLDVPFLAFFVLVELSLALQKKTIKPLISSEWLLFVGIAALNILRLLQLEEPVRTYFWQWVMPLKLFNYCVYDPNLYGPQACPDRRDVLYGMALALGLAFLLAGKRSFFMPFVTIMIAGFCFFILEKQGLSRDLSLVIFGSCATFLLSLMVCTRKFVSLLPQAESNYLKKSRRPALFLASATITALLAVSLNGDRDRMHTFVIGRGGEHYADIVSVYSEKMVWQDPVMVGCDYPQAAYPALLNLNGRMSGYLLWWRPLRLFDFAIRNCVLTDNLKAFYDYVCRQLRADLQSRIAKTLVVQKFEEELLERAGLMPVLQSNYKLEKECRLYSYNRQPREFVGLPYFHVYTRKDR